MSHYNFLMLAWSVFFFGLFSLIVCVLTPRKSRFQVVAVLNLFFSIWFFTYGAIVLFAVSAINYFLLQRKRIKLALILSLTPLFLLRLPIQWSWKEIYLSLALAFFCLQQIGAIIDIGYRQHERPGSFTLWMAFSTFFPSLLAGPISRWTVLSQNILNPKTFTEDEGWSAIFLFLKGLFKKMVFALPLIVILNSYFQNPQAYGIVIALAMGFFFRFAIWADISAHTDWARGLSLLMCIDLPKNFERPFLSLNLADFWRRWHITLSTWLQDFIFFPLAMGPLRRKIGSKFVLAISVLITFSVFGLWHGITIGFLIMGFIKGAGVLAQQKFNSFFKNHSLENIFLKLSQVFFISFFVMLPTLLLRLSISDFLDLFKLKEIDFLQISELLGAQKQKLGFILIALGLWVFVDSKIFRKPQWQILILFLGFFAWLLLADFSSSLEFLYAEF